MTKKETAPEITNTTLEEFLLNTKKNKYALVNEIIDLSSKLKNKEEFKHAREDVVFEAAAKQIYLEKTKK